VRVGVQRLALRFFIWRHVQNHVGEPSGTIAALFGQDARPDWYAALANRAISVSARLTHLPTTQRDASAVGAAASRAYRSASLSSSSVSLGEGNGLRPRSRKTSGVTPQSPLRLAATPGPSSRRSSLAPLPPTPTRSLRSESSSARLRSSPRLAAVSPAVPIPVWTRQVAREALRSAVGRLEAALLGLRWDDDGPVGVDASAEEDVAAVLGDSNSLAAQREVRWRAPWSAGLSVPWSAVSREARSAPPSPAKRSCARARSS